MLSKYTNLGYRIIDDQHKTIIDKITQINDDIKNSKKEIDIKNFIEYFKEHIKFEEKIASEFECDYLSIIKLEHRDLLNGLRLLEDIIELYNNTKISQIEKIALEYIEISIEYLLKHFSEHDKKIIDYIIDKSLEH